MNETRDLSEGGEVESLRQALGRFVALILLSPLFLLLALLHTILHPKRSGPELQSSRHPRPGTKKSEDIKLIRRSKMGIASP